MSEMTTDKQKHLSFVQDTVRRMSQNSFLIKGWCVGIVSALLAFSAKEGLPVALKVSFLPIAFFWLLDGYYLSLERRYRRLYDEVRVGAQPSDYSLDTGRYRRGNARLFRAIVSVPIILLYLALAIVIELVSLSTGQATLVATVIDLARLLGHNMGLDWR